MSKLIKAAEPVSDAQMLRTRLQAMERALQEAERNIVILERRLAELHRIGDFGSEYRAIMDQLNGSVEFSVRNGRGYMQYLPGLHETRSRMRDQIARLRELMGHIVRTRPVGEVGWLARMWSRCASVARGAWRVAGRIVAPISLIFEGVIAYNIIIEIAANQQNWDFDVERFRNRINGDSTMLNKIRSHCNNNTECVNGLKERIAKSLTARLSIEIRRYAQGERVGMPTLNEIYNQFKTRWLNAGN